MDIKPLTRAELAGLGAPPDAEFDDTDDEFDPMIPLGKYLTDSEPHVTIAPAIDFQPLVKRETGDVKMATSGELTPAQLAAQERAAEKKAAILAKMDAKTKAQAEAKAKKEADAKAKAEKAKADAKAKEEAAKAAAKAKAEKEKEAARAAKEKAEAKAKADKEKAAAKAADAKAKEAARKEREKARAAAHAARLAAGGKDRLVPANLDLYHKDTEKKTAGGHVSVDRDDELAKKLRGLPIDAVYKEASKVLKEDEKALRGKYAHLNVGMQRMNLGNRMRAAQAKGH